MWLASVVDRGFVLQHARVEIHLGLFDREQEIAKDQNDLGERKRRSEVADVVRRRRHAALLQLIDLEDRERVEALAIPVAEAAGEGLVLHEAAEALPERVWRGVDHHWFTRSRNGRHEHRFKRIDHDAAPPVAPVPDPEPRPIPPVPLPIEISW